MNSTKCNPIVAKTPTTITWQQEKTPKPKRKRKAVTPQERKEKCAKAKTDQNTITISHRFEILDDNDDESEKTTTFIRTPKPEPIFVTEVTNITELKSYLNSLLGINNKYQMTTMIRSYSQNHSHQRRYIQRN